MDFGARVVGGFVALGKLGGRKGGPAGAEKLSPEQRRKIRPPPGRDLPCVIQFLPRPPKAERDTRDGSWPYGSHLEFGRIGGTIGAESPRSRRVSDGLILPIVLGFFSLVGVWMFTRPEHYVLWIKIARHSLGLKENDPRALATARFIGGCFVACSILFFVAFVFERYRG
jgi:hypothetical protein